MANIFKTTLKKDIITDIVDNEKREIRFPITKFWASRLADNYNLDDKTFEFKTFDFLELSSPSNKETDGITYIFDYVKTILNGDEFVLIFKNKDDITALCECNKEQIIEHVDEIKEISKSVEINDNESGDDSDVVCDEYDDEEQNISNYDMCVLIKQLLDDNSILENFYNDEYVFATNAKQILVLPNGKPLGFKKTLPVNNDVVVKIEFDKHEKIYFDIYSDFERFEDVIRKKLSDIRKNNFVFVWKHHTGIFMDNSDRIYFGIKYSTRRSVGLKCKYDI